MASYEEEELPPDPSEETLTIEARFQPLLPETMTKSKDGFLGVSWGPQAVGSSVCILKMSFCSIHPSFLCPLCAH